MAKKPFWTPPPLPTSIIPEEAFDVGDTSTAGKILFADDEIEINKDRPFKSIVMKNTGDRPIQIGAHYHLAECNKAMAFDREAAFGFRLDIASGSAIRLNQVKAAKFK